LCEIDKAVILRAAFDTDDKFMNRGEVVETGVVVDSLLEIMCCCPDIADVALNLQLCVHYKPPHGF
jgi:hypothetical protein